MGEGKSGSTCLRCCSLYRSAALSNTTLPYPVLPCEMILRVPVKYRNMYWQLAASYPTVNSTDIFAVTWLRGYKTFFMLNSNEHEIFSAHKF